MYSIPTSLSNITNCHQDIVTKKGSSAVLCNSHKSMSMVVAKSSFKPSKVSKSSAGQTTSTQPVKHINPNGLFTSLKSSLISPLMSEISDILVSYLNAISTKVLNPPLHPSVDPKLVLTGNFAPVDETPPTECLVVEGELPPSLNGAYIRNGPNPQHQPLGPHHLWSGDGMLHSILLSNGRAIYCSRYVGTYKYKLERDKGFPTIPNAFSGFYGLKDICTFVISLGRAIAERINLIEAFGLANTSLAFFHGSLFALMDGDLPYRIRLTEEGDIETLGRYNPSGKGPINMTAHPKIDIETEDLFALQLHITYPYLTFFRFETSCSIWKNVPISSVNHLSYVHDFAITKQYAIVPDTQLEISLINLLLCKGIPLSYRATKVSRIGVIPRYSASESEMRWFQVPGFNAFHFVNAWEEEDDHIVIITPTISSPDNFLYEVNDYHMFLEKVRIDMKTGNISRTILSEQCVEMGTINNAYRGKQNRYVYMAINGGSLKWSGVIKIDLELEREVASRCYGDGCFGGEAFFVAASDAKDPHCDEDDGFVVSFVHNETSNESHFVVMDAKSLDFVAKVKLPGRVPYGLHGLYVCEEQLKNL